MEYLIVDGYNVIGASKELAKIKEQSLEEARYLLQEALSEYSAFAERQVIIVYDAHLSKGNLKKSSLNNLRIDFTKEGVTADEYIEKLVTDYIRSGHKVYVATSDFLEQRVVFGKGALRISSRELWHEIEVMKRRVSEQLSEQPKKRAKLTGSINPEIARIFEKWRRK
ncbi:NYN domain-containing protein [Desulfuribacillus alkaliarsenatis]|uniref:RNA-binding protein n=1 Tax=Desulfuribacillus alkaliarsenatis TaxID=766136 RepID=A0A1E5G4D5_9FIRM|nr:NYN domain-containing protein [Desulfuribacillus alkaliarsenatis]OEF97955.1 hypothetical protein BHF68_12865 [Desulfuribacillus alkaliarsenatis]